MGLVEAAPTLLNLPQGIILRQQTYEKQPMPNGVVLVRLNVFYDDWGGWFKETLRVDDEGDVISLKEVGIKFQILQANVSYIAAGAERFWHIHPDRKDRAGQNELWTVNKTLLCGLKDLRQGSSTYGMETKVVLSPHLSLYIPAGVAHGFINPNNTEVTLSYFADQRFSPTDTREYRIDPKDLPYDFVRPEVM